MVVDFNSLKSGNLNIGDYYYCIITAISKRAREIVENSDRSPDNPVMEAFKEFENGKFAIEVFDE